MSRLAQFMSKALVLCAIVTVIAADQPQDRHFAVDSIVSETDAIHAGAPELASGRASPQAAITTPEAGPEGAMTDKVMKLLQDMMLKKQAAQAKKTSSPQVQPATQKKSPPRAAASPTSDAKVQKAAKAKAEKTTDKVMKLLSQMLKKKAQPADLSSHAKAKKVAKKVQPKKHTLRIRHVKNGLAMLNKLAHQTEDEVRRREARAASKAKELVDKKTAAKVQKKKVDPLQLALTEASNYLDSRSSREVQKKKNMAESLKAAQKYSLDDDDDDDFGDDDDDYLGVPSTAAVEVQAAPTGAEPASLSDKGKSLLANLMSQHDAREKEQNAVKLAAQKKAEAKKAAAKKAAEAKKQAKVAALAAAKAKKAKALAAAKAKKARYMRMGVHADALPRAKHHEHKAEHMAADKKHVSLVDQALMSMMTVDLKTASAPAVEQKEEKHSPPAMAEAMAADGEDALAEEEAFGREVEKNMHREASTKAQRKNELLGLRHKELATKKAQRIAAQQQLTQKATNGEAADKKAGKMVKQEHKQLKKDVGSDDDIAAALAAKLFKQLGGKAMKAEDLRAAVAKHVAKAAPAPKVAAKVVAAAPKVAKAPKVAAKVVAAAPKVAKAPKVVQAAAKKAPKVAVKPAKVAKAAKSQVLLEEEKHVTNESLEIVKDLETAVH